MKKDHISEMIADCESKILELTGIVDKLRWFRREFPHAAAAVIVKRRRRRKAKPARRKAKPAQAGRKPDKKRTLVVHKTRAVGPSTGAGTLGDRILEILGKKSPLAPGIIVDQLDSDKRSVRNALELLEEAGKVNATGVKRSRLIHLGAADAPMPARAEKVRDEKPSELGQVEARDRAVLLRIRGAGNAGRTFRELMIALPDESEAALEASLTRLRVKKAIRQDGDRWVAA